MNHALTQIGYGRFYMSLAWRLAVCHLLLFGLLQTVVVQLFGSGILQSAFGLLFTPFFDAFVCLGVLCWTLDAFASRIHDGQGG